MTGGLLDMGCTRFSVRILKVRGGYVGVRRYSRMEHVWLFKGKP